MSNSWLHLTEQDQQYQLDKRWVKEDRFAARDCGWVEQMRPFIRQFSQPGDLVLDPFCGFASSLIAAELEGRRAIGIDIDAERISLAQQRLTHAGFGSSTLLCGDAEILCCAITPVDLLISNMPYFGCDWKNEREGQLYSVADYQQYLQKARQCLKVFRRLLKPSAYIVLMVENIRVGPHFIPQAWDLARLLRERFLFIDERILVYDKPVTHPEGVLSNRAHEYVLIAQNAAKEMDTALATEHLVELYARHPEMIIYGSFARWFADQSVQPSDVDIFLPYNPLMIQQISDWLIAQGFGLTRWGAELDKEVLPLALPGTNYLRAEKLDAQGRLVIIDLSFSQHNDSYQRLMEAKQYLHGLPCVVYPIKLD